MTDFINNFYVKNLMYIIIFILLAIYAIDKRKNKYKDNIKNKLNFKNIDLKYLIGSSCLTLGISIILFQVISLLPIETSDNGFDINVLSICVYFITTCLLGSILEEIVFRFGLYEYFNAKIKPFYSILITSLIFSIFHMYGLGGIIILFIISIIWNYSYYKTNNLIYPIVSHFVYNLYIIINNLVLNDVISMVIGCLCIIIYIILKIKSSNKNVTAKD